MSKMGDGYGSEYWLKQWLTERVEQLNERVLDVTGGTTVEWLSPVLTGQPTREWRGVEFVQDTDVARAWRQFWPQYGNVPNWDAIGKQDGPPSWLLIEAKGHLGELRAPCQAKDIGGRPMIEKTLTTVKQALGADPASDWLGDYYQFANRLAVLWFLLHHSQSAHLVYIYFYGDQRPDGSICPQSPDEWTHAIDAKHKGLGLPANHPLSDHIHEVFLPVHLKRL